MEITIGQQIQLFTQGKQMKQKMEYKYSDFPSDKKKRKAKPMPTKFSWRKFFFDAETIFWKILGYIIWTAAILAIVYS